jgi:hypothetical protein
MGTVYEYAIENLHAAESVAAAERLVVEEAARDARKVGERRNRHGGFFFGHPTADVPFFLHVTGEIVSATGFEDEGGHLFAEYERERSERQEKTRCCASGASAKRRRAAARAQRRRAS